MVSTNLTVKELFNSIPCTRTISHMMINGIEQGSTQLACSAMEELLRRGDLDEVAENIKSAIKTGNLKLQTSMSVMIANSLLESRDADSLLRLLGKGLLKENVGDMKTVLDRSKKPVPDMERTAFNNIANLLENAKFTSGPENIAYIHIPR